MNRDSNVSPRRVMTFRTQPPNTGLRFCLPLVCLGTLLPIVTAQAQNSISPDRLAAEWVVRMGGCVVLEGQEECISELDRLPFSEFHLRSISLVGTLIEPPKLALLTPLTHLRELILPASMWNPQCSSKL